jgi:hypothetical protein
LERCDSKGLKGLWAAKYLILKDLEATWRLEDGGKVSPSPDFFISVDSKSLEVLCFVTLSQVVILKELSLSLPLSSCDLLPRNEDRMDERVGAEGYG